MALVDDVQSRFSSQYLINLTNPQNAEATTIDSSRLTNAANDVQQLFTVHAGVAYASTNAMHVMAAVASVIDMLRVYSGQVLYSEVEQAMIARFKSVALVTGRDRIKASTDSLLDPTSDQSGDLPKSDRNNFRGYVPRAPGSAFTSDAGQR